MVSIGITIVCLLNSSEALNELIETPYNSYRDIVTIFNYLIHYDQFRSVMIAIASLAYSFSYCHDKNNHCMEILLYRGTLKSYALSKIIANAVAVLLSFLLGVFIYFLILHIWFPILDESTINSTGGVFGIYNDFIENRRPYLILSPAVNYLEKPFFSYISPMTWVSIEQLQPIKRGGAYPNLRYTIIAYLLIIMFMSLLLFFIRMKIQITSDH